MSPHNVNNFVSDLVEMAKAMERVPLLERELADARHVLDEMGKQADGLRSDIDQAKAYASTLEQKVHDLEVAKDQAETMFLEADDRFNRTLDFVKTAFGSAGALIQAVEVKADMKQLGEDIAFNYPNVPPIESADLSHTPSQGQSETPKQEESSSLVQPKHSQLEQSSDSSAGQSDPLPSPVPSPAEPDASTHSVDGPDGAKSSTEEPRYFDYDGGNHFYRG